MIDAAVVNFPAARGQPPDAWRSLAGAKPELPSIDPELDLEPVPYLIPGSDYKRAGARVTAQWFDPPHDAEPIPYLEVLDHQARLLADLASTRSVNGRPENMTGYLVLGEAVRQARERGGPDYALGFVDRLHEDRWSPGAGMTATLLTQARYGLNPDGGSDNPVLLNTLLEEIERDVARAKDEARSLTAWGEALHLLAPRIAELRSHAEESSFERVRGWVPHLDRLRSDLDAVHSINLKAAIGIRTGVAAGWVTLLSNLRNGKTSTEFRQGLEHLYHERIAIPRFWQEAAATLYDTPDDALPPEITTVDPYRAVSFDALEFWSGQWLETLREVGSHRGA